MDVTGLAAVMLDECARAGQSARRLGAGGDAEPLRRALRASARERALRIRTALLDDVVVVVRTDAALWSQDAATMRAKLTPPD